MRGARLCVQGLIPAAKNSEGRQAHTHMCTHMRQLSKQATERLSQLSVVSGPVDSVALIQIQAFLSLKGEGHTVNCVDYGPLLPGRDVFFQTHPVPLLNTVSGLPETRSPSGPISHFLPFYLSLFVLSFRLYHNPGIVCVWPTDQVVTATKKLVTP